MKKSPGGSGACVSGEHFNQFCPINGTVIINTMLNYDGHGHPDATCKQSFSVNANIFVGGSFSVTDSTSEHSHTDPHWMHFEIFKRPHRRLVQ